MNAVQALYDHLSARDACLLAATPCVMMPRFGALPDLAVHGRRYIAAQDGWYLEARSESIHVCVHLARTARPLPYGPCAECVDLRFGLLPASLIGGLRREAVKACPNEWAALVIADPMLGGYRAVRPEVETVSGGHIRYRVPPSVGDTMFLDLHSHGRHPAFFSGTDDADDAHGIFIASVFGRCESEITVESASRIVIDGAHFPIDWHPWEEP